MLHDSGIRPDGVPPGATAPNLHRFPSGRTRSRVPVLVAASAMTLLVAVPAGGPVQRPKEANSAVAPLVRALENRRLIEARLSGGFAGGPITQTTRGSRSLDLSLMKAAADIDREARRVPSMGNLHALAVAHLLMGDPDAAINGLRELSESDRRNAEIWSDLSAALLTRARETGESADLPGALEAAERAVELDPFLVEGMTNRALALEEFFLTGAARAAWEKVEATDPDDQWRSAARSRITALAGREPWRPSIEDLNRAVAERREDRMTRFARERPELVQRWLEESATRSAADLDRSTILFSARTLREIPRDRSVSGILEQLAAVRQDPELMEIYAATVRHFEANEWGLALKGLEALHLDSRLPSGLRPWVSFRLASVHLLRQRARGAHELEQLLAAPDVEARPFLLGRILTTLAVLHSSGGDWDEAIRLRARAAAAFERAGMLGWSALLRQQIGEVNGKHGLTEIDWPARLDLLKHSPDLFDRRNSLLAYTLVGDDLTRSQLPRAAALAYSAAKAEAVAADLPDSIADTALSLSLAQRSLSRAAALSTLAESAAATERIRDADLRDRLRGEILRARALITPQDEKVVDASLKWLDGRRSKARKLPILVARGLSLYSSGDDARAIETLESAITLDEEMRSRDPELADASQATVLEAFGALLEARARRGDSPRELLNLADRYWSRRAGSAATATMPDICSLSFFPGADHVLAWHACEGSVAMKVLPRRLGDLKASVNRLLTPGGRERESRRLYDDLIAPWESALSGRSTLTLLVTGVLARVPFGALVDGSGRPLLEKMRISYVPSLDLVEAVHPVDLRTRGLAVSASRPANGLPGLPGAAAEARRIADLTSSTLLDSEAATAPAVLERLSGAGFFHFAGHAVVNDARPFESRLILSASGDAPSSISLREIRARRADSLQLVVLAGCSTSSPGAVGSSSLASAFVAAGARTVIGSSWPIADSSLAEAMPLLYDALAHGVQPDEALRRLYLTPSLSEPTRRDLLALTVFHRRATVRSRLLGKAE